MRQVAADAHAAHAVAAGVEQRREHADAELARLDRHDPAADPALGGQADIELPAAGEIVHAAGGHDAQHVADMVGAQRPLAGDRVDAAIGQGGGHDREVARGDQDRALHEVEVEMLLDIALDHPGIELEIGDRPVAVPGLDLGAVDAHVDVDRMADEALEGRQHARAALGLVLALDQRRGGDRTGIDHGIERPVVAFVEGDRVEGIARRLDADAPQHLRMAPILECQAIDDGLGDRLDGEAGLLVAGVVAEAVRGHERDREPARVRRGQLGDVAGEVAVGEVHVAGVQFVEQPLDRVAVHGVEPGGVVLVQMSVHTAGAGVPARLVRSACKQRTRAASGP